MNVPRFPDSLDPNRQSDAVRRAREAGLDLLDFTQTNPTRARCRYPQDLLRGLASPEALVYAPRPFGLASAREAVAADYRRRGADVDPDRIVLTASTSEAYAWLFKLLCAPGEAVLVPAPSYPLFEHLARLDGVVALPYRLEYHGRWSIDFDSIDRAWRAGVRAILAVSPNNPTGSCMDRAELSALGERCAHFGAGLVIDEVFADYPLGNAAIEALVPPSDCLTVRLGGLSKSAGLPQVKLGWMAVDGPDRTIAPALERLELIADTYLSVSTPVQVAAPSLIESGAIVREQILGRIRGNYRALRAAAAAYPASDVLPADGGWSAVLRVPAIRTEEALVLELLEQHGVLVHPGFFFDFAHEAFLVLSLLTEPAAFAGGVALLLELANG
jgi:aspartate/methionine/tyrosine aminotransferase